MSENTEKFSSRVILAQSVVFKLLVLSNQMSKIQILSLHNDTIWEAGTSSIFAW